MKTCTTKGLVLALLAVRSLEIVAEPPGQTPATITDRVKEQQPPTTATNINIGNNTTNSILNSAPIEAPLLSSGISSGLSSGILAAESLSLPTGTNAAQSRVGSPRILSVEEAGGVIGFLRQQPHLQQLLTLVNPFAPTNISVGGFRSPVRPTPVPRAFRDPTTHEAEGWNLIDWSW